MIRSVAELSAELRKAARGVGAPLAVAEDLAAAADRMDGIALAEMARILTLADAGARLAQLGEVLDRRACGLEGSVPEGLSHVVAALDRPAGQVGPVEVAAQVWQVLTGCAARTYVPASAASRAAGAGAGLSDND